MQSGLFFHQFELQVEIVLLSGVKNTFIIYWKPALSYAHSWDKNIFLKKILPYEYKFYFKKDRKHKFLFTWSTRQLYRFLLRSPE